MCEVGVEYGKFSRRILDVSSPRTLKLVDLSFSGLRSDVASDPRVRLLKGMSWSVIDSLPDASLDWIYIDADHSFSGVTRDAEAALPKVKPGGYIVFNDFGHIDPMLGRYGVHRAVTEFAIRRRLPFAWLAYQGMAMYDVALKKPDLTGS